MSRYKRHRLSKLDLLEYALSGAVTERGLQSGNMSDSEEEQLDAAMRCFVASKLGDEAEVPDELA